MARYRFVKGFKSVDAASVFLQMHRLEGDVFSRLRKSDSRQLYLMFIGTINIKTYPVIAVWVMSVDNFYPC